MAVVARARLLTLQKSTIRCPSSASHGAAHTSLPGLCLLLIPTSW